MQVKDVRNYSIGLLLVGFGIGVALGMSKYHSEVLDRIKAVVRDPTMLLTMICVIVVYLIIYDVTKHETNFD